MMNDASIFGYEDDLLRRLALSCKILVCLVCLYGALSGHYPPAHAQIPPPKPTDTISMPQQFAISPYDPEFKADIDRMEQHLEASDVRREAMRIEVETNKTDIREMQTNLHWFFWVIGGLLSGSIALPQVKELAKKLAGVPAE